MQFSDFINKKYPYYTEQDICNNLDTLLEEYQKKDSKTCLIKDFSENELSNILRKVKLAEIKKGFRDILEAKNGKEYDDKEGVEFIQKYEGKEVHVYEWAGDWWICEDDNYPIPESSFLILH